MNQTISAPVPADDDFLLTEQQQALPTHLRARHVAMRHACSLVHFDTSGRDLVRVTRALIHLWRAAHKSGQRWDDAWDQARLDVGPLIDADMTDTVKNVFHAIARGQASPLRPGRKSKRPRK